MNLLCLLAIMVALLTVSEASAGVITSAGSTTVQPAMKACAKVYKRSHANFQIIIAGGGSSKGVKTIARGKVDIGRASRAMKAKEIKKYPDVKRFLLGTDGVALVVNANNSITGLSSAQVEQLFKGDIHTWAGVGGGSETVNLISLGTEHGTYELFAKKFHLKGEESGGQLVFDQGHAWIAFSQDVALDKVAHDPNAITFASVGVADEYARYGNIKVIPLDGIEPSSANVVSGAYKLSRPLLLLSKGEPHGEVKNFISYMQGAECQAIVKKMGYIPLQ